MCDKEGMSGLDVDPSQIEISITGFTSPSLPLLSVHHLIEGDGRERLFVILSSAESKECVSWL